jgi:hypothetical protein
MAHGFWSDHSETGIGCHCCDIRVEGDIDLFWSTAFARLKAYVCQTLWTIESALTPRLRNWGFRLRPSANGVYPFASRRENWLSPKLIPLAANTAWRPRQPRLGRG